MKIYVRSTSLISAQDTFGKTSFPEKMDGFLRSVFSARHPDYKVYFKPQVARRMGKLVKMGVSAGVEALNAAHLEKPDAILTGTGMGCIEDTERFLLSVIENGETLLTPTSFIQSTHNTVGGQIALYLQCRNYNLTYVHRGFSFESALLDALLLFQEGEAAQVLVGGVDELTENHMKIYRKLDHWKQEVNNLEMLEDDTPGTLPGEGAAFFVLSSQSDPDDLCTIEALEMIYRPDKEFLKNHVLEFLERNGLHIREIDMVLTGMNGNPEEDEFYNYLKNNILFDTPMAAFKHFSGDFPTASAVGLWYGVMALKSGTYPQEGWMTEFRPKTLSRILFINNFRLGYFSFILLTV